MTEQDDGDKTNPYDRDKPKTEKPEYSTYTNNMWNELRVKSWYERNKTPIKIAAAVGAAYFLNKRAVRKVVTKVVRKELTQFAQDEMELALSPEWQQKILGSYANNGFFNKI